MAASLVAMMPSSSLRECRRANAAVVREELGYGRLRGDGVLEALRRARSRISKKVAASWPAILYILVACATSAAHGALLLERSCTIILSSLAALDSF